MKHKILICEDEPAFLEGLKKEIAFLFDQEKQAYEFFCCESGAEFEETIKNQTPDLMFMDICLGDRDGLQLVEEYRKQGGSKVPVVFVSSMEDRVLEGYEVNALAFLYKRNYKDRLEKTIQRFLRDYAFPKRITIQGGGQVTVLDLREIYYLETDGRKTLVHTETDSLQSDLSIGAFSAELPEKFFFEVYKAVFVNLEHVSRIGDDEVLLENGDRVPMSRRKRKLVVQAVMQYIGGR